MNELTREASKQTILEAISFLGLGGRGRVRKSLRTQEKPLKGCFTDYTTENPDVSSPCERLPQDYQDHLDRRWRKKMNCHDQYYLDVDGFRSWCEELDKDKAWIEKTEKELF